MGERAEDRRGSVAVRRPLLVLAALSLLGVGVIGGFTAYQSRSLARSSALHHARLYSDALKEFRALYTSEVVETVRGKGVAVTHDYVEHPGAIPLPATLSMLLGERIGTHRSGAHTRLYSAYPFPWRQADHELVFADSFSRRAWEELSADPSAPFSAFVELEGRPVLRFATPDLMRPACVSCHNTHPASPKKDWKTGDVRGVLEVILPLDQSEREARQGVGVTIGLGSAMAVFMVSLVGFGLAALRRNAAELEASAEEARAAAERADAARRSAEDLARSNQDLEQFAYVASHDLRAPLRKIRQFGDLLKRRAGGTLGEESDDYLDRMTGAAARMDRLISDLLQFSRVSADDAPLQPVNLFEIASEVLEDLEVQVRESGGRVQVDVLPKVHANPTQMRMLLQNLIGNALKFRRPDTPPDVRVTAALDPTPHPDAGPIHRISVIDDGIGFEPEFIDRMFDVFGRLHAQTEYKGTGIGLAICKKIVEHHGGTLRATPNPGDQPGATFTFTIPASPPDERRESVKRVARGAETGERSVARGLGGGPEDSGGAGSGAGEGTGAG